MSIDTQCIVLTDDNFRFQVLESKALVLVDCWASWCDFFLPVNPIFNELAIEFGELIKVGRLNVAMFEKLAAHYDIRAVPTLLLFQDGQVLERIIGSVSKQNLARRLSTLSLCSKSSRSRVAYL